MFIVAIIIFFILGVYEGACMREDERKAAARRRLAARREAPAKKKATAKNEKKASKKKEKKKATKKEKGKKATTTTTTTTATPPITTTKKEGGGEKKDASPATPKETCHLTMIIDRSGSMQSLGDSVLSGVQTYLQELSAVDERDSSDTTVLFSTFDDKYQVKHNGVSIKDAQAAITAADIEPRGMTALHDAIGFGLRDTQDAVRAMPTKPGKVVVFILTDGQENSSKKWNAKSIKKQIAKLEAAPYNYAFFFAAAGQDALDTGARMGLGADDCITWSPDRRATAATFGAVAEATTSHRRGMSKAFSPMHRQSCYTIGDGDGGGGGGGGVSGSYSDPALAHFRHRGGGGGGRLGTPARARPAHHHHGYYGGGAGRGVVGGLFGAPAPAAPPAAPQHQRGVSFGVPATAPAPSPAPAASPAGPAAPAPGSAPAPGAPVAFLSVPYSNLHYAATALRSSMVLRN